MRNSYSSSITPNKGAQTTANASTQNPSISTHIYVCVRVSGVSLHTAFVQAGVQIASTPHEHPRHTIILWSIFVVALQTKLKSHNQHFWATVKSNELLLIIAFYYKYTVADFDFQITSALIKCECALIFT